MKLNDVVFLTTVCVCAVVFVAWSLVATFETPQLSGAASARRGVAGKARDIDIDEIRNLIERGRLSDHEADYYSNAPPEPDPEPVVSEP